VDFWPTEYDGILRHDHDHGVTLDVFRILSKNEYCEYCHSIF